MRGQNQDMESGPVNDRRCRSDRRAKPTKPLSRYTFWGRRESARRAGEERNLYVDRYRPALLFTVLFILILNVLDAYFTLHLTEHGAREINPFMKYLVEKDPLCFLVIKYIIMVPCVIFLLVHKNFYVFRGKINVKVFIILVLIFYAALVGYELLLYFRL
ncbi:hypothetical protein DRQ11_00160 [candidate division KSB1 bacterium]|nr:MAG: hypothetical protein DRQ11_00160 [candidate division KSB1 bacterium]